MSFPEVSRNQGAQGGSEAEWTVVPPRKGKTASPTPARQGKTISPAHAALSLTPISSAEIAALNTREVKEGLKARIITEKTSRGSKSYVVGIEILKVRFSQSSIGKETTGEMPLEELETSIATSWNEESWLRLVDCGEFHVSLDNRRLYASKRVVQSQNPSLKVRVKVFKPTDTVPSRMLAPIRSKWIIAIGASAQKSQSKLLLVGEEPNTAEERYNKLLQEKKITKGTNEEYLFIRSDCKSTVGFTTLPLVRK